MLDGIVFNYKLAIPIPANMTSLYWYRAYGLSDLVLDFLKKISSCNLNDELTMHIDFATSNLVILTTINPLSFSEEYLTVERQYDKLGFFTKECEL